MSCVKMDQVTPQFYGVGAWELKEAIYYTCYWSCTCTYIHVPNLLLGTNLIYVYTYVYTLYMYMYMNNHLYRTPQCAEGKRHNEHTCVGMYVIAATNFSSLAY